MWALRGRFPGPLHRLLRCASTHLAVHPAQAPAAMQQRRWGSGSGGRAAAAASPPCIYHLRGHCRFGAHCRFSHDVAEAASRALPLHHRALVHSASAPAGVAAAGAAVAPWHFRIMSYNILADCLAHEHAAELYTSVPRFALEWGWRSGLILRCAGGRAAELQHAACFICHRLVQRRAGRMLLISWLHVPVCCTCPACTPAQHHCHSLLPVPYAGRSCTTGPMWCACRRWTTSARWVPGDGTGVKLL